ncbi:hypothetical protein H2201_009125, partial [Coniosporium apollinis]
LATKDKDNKKLSSENASLKEKIKSLEGENESLAPLKGRNELLEGEVQALKEKMLELSLSQQARAERVGSIEAAESDVDAEKLASRSSKKRKRDGGAGEPDGFGVSEA